MSLYTSASGRQVSHASSSSLDAYRFCRRKFQLNRVLGWKEKDQRAALEFGKCIESAIQYYHANGLKPGDAPSEFERLWAKWLGVDLKFTAQEGSWSDLNQMGQEMTRLYEIVLPSLPIKNPKFQLMYSKSLWPGTNLADLEFLGYIDLLSTLEDGTRIIIDIKTAKSSLDVTPNMLAMDSQLRRYAWVSGIQEVGFLNFVKARPDSLKHGDVVTLLDETLNWKPGKLLTVFKNEVKTNKDTGEVSTRLMLGEFETVRLLDEFVDTIKGKGSTEAKEATITYYLATGQLAVVPQEAITKTRLQFLRATIPAGDMADIGQSIGHEMRQIEYSSKENFFPMDGGVKFPDQKCTWCAFRGICLGDKKLRDEMLVQITKPEPDWLTELEEVE